MSTQERPRSGAGSRQRGDRRRTRLRTASVAVAALVAFAACGGDDSDAGGEDGTTTAATTAEPTTTAAPGDSTAPSDTSAPATDESTSAPTTVAASDDGEPQAGGSFTMLRTGPTPANWDPTDASSDGMADPGGTGVLLEAVYGVLAYEDYTTGEVVPSMAESITTTDGATWRLTLRDGITFTDGTSYDAEAVQFNWERHRDPALVSPHASIVENIASLTVVDPLNLDIVLAEPNAQFDRVIARNLPFVGSPTAIESDLDGFRTNPVGAGPFVLEDYLAEQEATFMRNPDYFDAPKPYLDQLTIVNVADDEQRYNSFVTGQGQLLQIFTAYSRVGDAEAQGYQVFPNHGGGGTGMLPNLTRPPFDDPLARQALAAALDVAKKTETLDFGVTKPLETIFAEGNPYYDASLTLPQYDKDQAQELLDEYAAKTGGPLRFTFSMFEGVRENGEFYQAQLQEFDNIEVELAPLPANEYVPALAQGNFDVALFPFAFGDPVDAFRERLATDAGFNFGKYSNPQMDDLLAQSASALTLDERVEIFKEIQRLFIEDLPYIFTNDNPDVQLATEEVKGLHYAIDGIPLWDGVWLAS